MRKYIHIVILVFVASFSVVNAQTSDSVIVKDNIECESTLIHFRFDKSVVDSGYMNNAASLRELDRVFVEKSAEIDSVVIIASGSPDGVIEYNQALATRRAKAMKGYIIWKYPHINQYKIFTHSIGEDWAGLRQLVEADVNAPYRDQILKTLSQDVNPSTKEWRLKQIDQGRAWNYMTNHYLRYLRAATTCVVYYKQQVAEESARQPIDPDPPMPMPQEVVVVEQEKAIERTPVVVEPTVELPIVSQVEIIKRPLFALKTNLLELAAGVANIGIEVRLSRKLSLDIPFAYSPYTLCPDYSIRVVMLRPELRYWFRNVFDGHFFGLHTGFAEYNISGVKIPFVKGSDKFRYEGWATGVGLSYGYSIILGRQWNMEFTAGAGLVYTRYNKFDCGNCGNQIDKNASKTFFAPTKLGITLMYMIK